VFGKSTKKRVFGKLLSKLFCPFFYKEKSFAKERGKTASILLIDLLIIPL